MVQKGEQCHRDLICVQDLSHLLKQRATKPQSYLLGKKISQRFHIHLSLLSKPDNNQVLDCGASDKLSSLRPSHLLLPKYLVYLGVQQTTDIDFVLYLVYQS